jgi:hypothetical protein
MANFIYNHCHKTNIPWKDAINTLKIPTSWKRRRIFQWMKVLHNKAKDKKISPLNRMTRIKIVLPLTICHCFICGSTKHKINNCHQRQATHEMFKENFQYINKDKKMLLSTCTIRNHGFFYQKFWLKKLPIWFFCPPCPTWPKCHFGQVDLDFTILTKSFWLVFFTRFFLPSFFYWTTMTMIQFG